eukprot:6610440-Karenia_brevis.AAC.1
MELGESHGTPFQLQHQQPQHEQLFGTTVPRSHQQAHRSWLPPRGQIQEATNSFMYMPLMLHVAGLLQDNAVRAWTEHERTS